MSIIEASFWVQVLILLTLWAFAIDAIRRRNPLASGGLRRVLTIICGVVALVVVVAVAASAYYS